MGLTRVSEEREPTPERFNSLRNFTSPPVKWGSKRRTNAAAGVIVGISVGGDRRSPAPESIQNKELLPPAPRMKVDEPTPAPAPETENVLPWNLRKRRGECDKGKELKIDEKEPNCSLFKPRNDSYNTQKVKFSVELSKKEIMEDFMAIMGHPPPRKPNKRPKVVQNQLNNLFPGLWLREVTPNLYKVPDSPKILKVPLRKWKKGKGSH